MLGVHIRSSLVDNEGISQFLECAKAKAKKGGGVYLATDSDIIRKRFQKEMPRELLVLFPEKSASGDISLESKFGNNFFLNYAF